ncbi:MAG TPA: GuaB3 family IMP dehydrogenase-related protein [Tepidiformaceae bacterium]|nr:GuaB3 family IMP dehydrogenase-related protein [Tepidiformaceae bacterium]
MSTAVHSSSAASGSMERGHAPIDKIPVPEFKQLRRAYGFDEVAIVPGEVTINPELVELGLDIGPHHFAIPFLASAMDAVVDPNFAVAMHKAGGLAVLNLEGVWTRYEDPGEMLQEVASASRDEATAILQNAYQSPIRDDLIARRIREIKDGGAVAAVSVTPMNTKKMGPIIQEAGADILVVQSTVTTARHESTSIEGLQFDRLFKTITIPVVVGNTVGFGATLEIMRTGVAAVLVGVGPGAACTSREVLGIGVPQVTATIECAAARDYYYKESGRYVPIITDGGIRTGGDVCKCIVSGADGVMMGSPFASTTEAPGRGYHWGMATPHANLPRGTRVAVGVQTTVQKLLYGPTSRTDGTENLVGALRTAMGMCGAHTVREFQQAEMVIAPAIKTEGKIYQFAQAGQ